MDPFTHTLLGAACGHAAGHAKLGRRAALVGAVAGAVPDLDVLIRSATDPLLTVELHRHFTHALPFAPLGALLVAAFWLIRPAHRHQWRAVWGCALAGYVSHCLLDAATSYGTVLFWPFSRQRFDADHISIIDPLFTLPLLAALVAGVRSNRAVWIRGGLAWCAAYLVLGAGQHHRALAAQALLAAGRGHVVERREAMPTLGNNVVWRSLYLADGRIYSDRIRVGWFSPATVQMGASLPRVEAVALTTEERQRNATARAFERFAWFSEGWVARSVADNTVLGDMRYSLSTRAFDPIWGIRFTPAGAASPVEWINRSRERRIDGREFWAEVTGRDPRYQPLDGLRP